MTMNDSILTAKRKMDNEDTTIPNVFQLPSVVAPDAAVSPKDEYFNKLDAFIESSGALGYSIIVGIEKEEDEDEEEDDDEEDENYTAEQLETLRLIIINANRSKCLEKAEKFVGITTNYYHHHYYYCYYCYHCYHCYHYYLLRS